MGRRFTLIRADKILAFPSALICVHLRQVSLLFSVSPCLCGELCRQTLPECWQFVCFAFIRGQFFLQSVLICVHLWRMVFGSLRVSAVKTLLPSRTLPQKLSCTSSHKINFPLCDVATSELHAPSRPAFLFPRIPSRAIRPNSAGEKTVQDRRSNRKLACCPNHFSCVNPTDCGCAGHRFLSVLLERWVAGPHA